MGRRSVVVATTKTRVCNGCGKRRDTLKYFYATPDGKPRGRKCIDCVRGDRVRHHERNKSDPRYLRKIRKSSLDYWYRHHDKNLAAQRERNRRHRKRTGI